MQGNYIFGGVKKGESMIDGKEVSWNKIVLSNGFRAFEVQNLTGKVADDFKFIPEKTRVNATFEIVPVKGDVAKVGVVKLEEAK